MNRSLILTFLIAAATLGTAACGSKKQLANTYVPPAPREEPPPPIEVVDGIPTAARGSGTVITNFGEITQGTEPPGPAPHAVGENLGATGLTHRVAIRHRSADQMLETLRTHLDSAYTDQELSRASVTADPRTNSLVFRTASTQAVWFTDSLRLIEQLDVPSPQASVLVALIARREEWGDAPAEIALQAARQNAWPAAEVVASARFLAEGSATLTGHLMADTGEEFPLEARVAMIDAAKGEVAFDYVRLFAPIASPRTAIDPETGGILTMDGTRTAAADDTAPADQPPTNGGQATPNRPIAEFKPTIRGGVAESVGPIVRDHKGFPVALAVVAIPQGS
jgi:hypothetical protein